MQRHLWQLGLLVVVAVATLMTNLGGSRLWDRDETRNAGCAAEMMARNDWVVPIFNHQLRDAKPVLLYWLIMSAYTVFGITEFAARFPSSLLGLGTVLATYVMAARLFNARVALYAGIILATSVMFEVAGHAATPDAPLIFCSTLALTVFVLSTFRPRPHDRDTRPPCRLWNEGHYFPVSWPAVAVMYGVMGFGLLAKGPVGLILPTAVIGMFLLIIYLPQKSETATTAPPKFRGRLLALLRECLRPFAPKHFLRTCWRMRLLTATVVSLAVAAPWYVWVGVRTNGDFLRGFFVDEHFGRATQAMEHHSGGPLFYVVALLVGFFPWSVFLVPIIAGAIGRIRRGDPWRAGYLLAVCWVGVYVVLFTLAATKLPSYVTPCYPGLAMLGGCFVHHLLRRTTLAPEHWIRFGLTSLAAVGFAVAIGLPIAAALLFSGDPLLGVVGLIPLIGAAVCLRFWRRRNIQGVVVSFSVMAVVMIVTAFGFGLERVDRHRRSFELLETVKQRGANVEIAAFGGLEPSLVFYSGQFIRPVTAERVQGDQAASAGVCQHSARLTQDTSAAAFLRHNHNGVILTTGRNYARLAAAIPQDVEILGQVPQFLRRDTLILLGRPQSTLRTASAPDDRRARQ